MAAVQYKGSKLPYRAMRRIAVIGNVGGGKTTLASALGRILNIPVFHFDSIQWLPGWQIADFIEIARQHHGWIEGEAWVIDGFGGLICWEWVEQRLAYADTIIFIDHPLIIHYLWTLKRQAKFLFRPTPELPEYFPAPTLRMTLPLLKRVQEINRTYRPRLVAMLYDLQRQKQIIHLQSPKDTAQLLNYLRSKNQESW
jgi:adenylate kinase family enzyme